MSLIKDNIELLYQVQRQIQQFSESTYQEKLKILSGASLGQHIRHIVEFYVCLETGYSKGKICYDERKRDGLLETDIDYVLQTISRQIEFLESTLEDKNLELKAGYSLFEDEFEVLSTSMHRELAYALDHTIHHLAIIKIAILALHPTFIFEENLGVAPSTVRFREQQNRQECKLS